MAGSAITEKWEYKTDIITAYDGHEQRIQTRQHPRHLVSFDYPAMNYLDAQWLRGLGRLKQNLLYYIPMWQSIVRLKDDYVGGLGLSVESECMYGLRDCEWVEIFVRDDIGQDGVNIVRQVDGYLNDSILLKKEINRKLDKRNTWIYPLRRCSVQPFDNLNYIWSNGTNMTHNFEDLLQKPSSDSVFVPDEYISYYEDYPQRNRWNLPEYIRNRNVLLISPQWTEEGSVSLSMDKATTRLDNDTGKFVYDMKNMNSYDIQTFTLSLMCRQAINNIVRFFNRVKGRYKSFYIPSWVNDISIIKDIEKGDNFLETNFSSISDFYRTNTRNKTLVIFTKDWQYYMVDILTYSYILRNKKKIGKVILKQPVDFNLSLDNILMASFLNLVRLDSDELQLNYETDSVANCTLVMREVDDDSSNVVTNGSTNPTGWLE